MMGGGGREDELLMKLQQCVGKVQSKPHHYPSKKETSNFQPRKSLDYGSFYSNERKNRETLQNRKKPSQFDYSQRYNERKDLSFQPQLWLSKKNNENYGRQAEKYPTNSNKYEIGFSTKRTINKNEQHPRQPLANVNSQFNSHKPKERIGKQSYENYKLNKNRDYEPSEKKQIPPFEQKEPQFQQKKLKRNYDKGTQYSYNTREILLQRSRKDDLDKNDEIKQYEKNIQKQTFISASRKESLIKSNVKNSGTIPFPPTKKNQTQSLNSIFSVNLPKKHQTLERSRGLERSRRLQSLSRENSVRIELQQMTMSKNQDTIQKLQKIGELNQRINERIKKIIETFQQPPAY